MGGEAKAIATCTNSTINSGKVSEVTFCLESGKQIKKVKYKFQFF